MRVKYVEQNNYYLISNHAVAKNSIFQKSHYCRRFINRIHFYLSPLCEILGHMIHDDEFVLVVKLAPRSQFLEYFHNKHPDKKESRDAVPANTYIFSQAMANLQSSMAIHFNRREERTGAVFARRFSKTLIRSAEDLEAWLRSIRKRRKFHKYSKRWSCYRRKKAEGAEKYRSWVRIRVGELKNYCKQADFSNRLQGQLKNKTILPQKAINQPNPPP